MRIVLVAIIFSVLSACATIKASADDDAAVLSVIMQNRCASAAKHPEQESGVLSDQAVVFSPSLGGIGLDDTAFKSLLSRNESAHQLPRLELCSAYELTPHKKIEAAMDRKGPGNGETGWEGFHKAFPKAGGIFYLSLPGYSADGTLAIVQVSTACDDLCGSAFYWTLRKIDGKWILEKSVRGWVS